MKKLLLIIIPLLIACNPVFKKDNAVIIGPQAVGDMPDEAKNVDGYKVRLMRTTETNVTPLVTFNGTQDTLTLWFNYKDPADDLPEGDLPYDILYERDFLNTDDIWDSDNDANLRFWTLLEAGIWGCTVTAINDAGTATSGRYDFAIEANAPVKLYLRGMFK